MNRFCRSRLGTQKPSLTSVGEGVAHVPVMLQEAVQQLAIKADGIYVDGTFGRGGHSREILRYLGDNGVLVVIDKDQVAIDSAASLVDKRVICRQGSFARLKDWVDELGFSGKISGILLDLGMCSAQLDDAERGFSFLRSGPLDMRMDQTQKLMLGEWLSFASESTIADVLWRYGEERFSRRIAKAIVETRKLQPIATTEQLAEIVAKANPRWEWHKHPATRTFQALRIFINDELTDLQNVLVQALDVLAVGGRLVVISFHSLEDRIVKRFSQEHAGRANTLSAVPAMLRQDAVVRLRLLGKMKPSVDEIKMNPQSRSAIMRVMEKVL